METRIGFYICHCGVNIAGKVDVEEVAGFIRDLPGVVVSRDYKFMCSDPGQEMIIEDIGEFRLNRVVVASCSPRLHGKTFMGVCRRAGMNPYCFQMASVREQVSWVTEDPDQATDKAKSLAAAAVNRVRRHEKLYARRAEVKPDVLVLGGGIAGIQAALDIGQSGRTAYLVERAPTIGGHMLQFDKTFPTLDCAACIGTPKMVEVAQNPNVKLFSYSEVTDVSGFIGNYTVTVLKKPRYVIEGVCTGCGECAGVCPVSIPSEWDERLCERKAVYRPFPQAVPITFCIDKRDRAPCTKACPAGVNVQGYVQLIGQGKYEEALGLIRERLPLPGVLGRVCPHPCEGECRRSEVDSPVALRALKRFAADHAPAAPQPPPEEEREERVAVVGSGPAGLAAACFLRRDGFRVTLFEASERLGGMLRSGIPDFRLPTEVLDREIGLILDSGVEARTGVSFGEDFTLETLSGDGFSAAFLAIGAQQGAALGIEAEDSPGAMEAVGFLREVNLGRDVEVGPRVVVIGGGNVALDAARVALRLGGKDVTIVYRRSSEEMPAHAEEIEEAELEGVKFSYLTSPVRVVLDGGCAAGLECVETRLGEPDSSGRRRPEPVEGTERVYKADSIIAAVGQRVAAPWAESEPDLEWTSRGTIRVDPETMQTSIPWVFAAGDSVTGPATVVEAVAGARRAARSIRRFLDGESPAARAEPRDRPEEHKGDWNPVPRGLESLPRAVPEHLSPEVAARGFEEVEKALDEDEAPREAARCLNCGGCSECMECVRVCEPAAIDHGMEAEEVRVEVGSLILATGYDLMDPGVITQFGYGRFPNVFTSLEFERLNNATGPTGGRILMRDRDGRFQGPPGSVGIVHCVGSRDDNYHEYCSRVCCMYALKYGHLIHDKVGPQVEVYNFYIDMRCFGKGYEEFYRRCQEEGIQFIRGKPAEIRRKNGKLVLVGEDTLAGRSYNVEVDMVILCAAMEPRADAAEVGRLFGITQSGDGFFLEEHPKLGPLSTASDGVFLAGSCQAPRDVPDTVAQASGAASKALSLAGRGEVEIEPTTSWIDPDICAGCRICIDLCPYGAIDFDPERRVSVVNDALCKGCGSCAAFCPSQAARCAGFKNPQIFAEMEGIFEAIHALGR